MKKVINILGYILFFANVLLPIGIPFAFFFGYTFNMTNYVVSAIVIAMIAVSVIVLGELQKGQLESRAVRILFALLAPISMINAVCYIMKSNHIAVAISMLVCIGSSWYLTIKYGKPYVLKVIMLVVSGVIVIPEIFAIPFVLIFSGFGSNTVVRTLESPSGAYYAEVIDSDQGALGGDTLVNVYEAKGFDAMIFNVYKRPERVYLGEWQEYKNMDIYWKDDTCLVIYSTEYEMK